MTDPAEFYSGIVVDAYARLKSSSFDPAPYAAFVREHGQPALEIGCGDGDPMLALVADGLDVDGVDSSLDMVGRCRERAVALGLDVEVHHQRVEDLDLTRRYPAIYFAGPTFNLLADDVTALRALQAIAAHLTDGHALVPLWVPDPTDPADLGVTREATGDDGAVLRYTAVSETYDVATRTRTTRTRYERATLGATVEVVEQDWVIHWHTPAGFTALCADAGLEVASLVDDAGAPAGEDATDVVATLRVSR